MYMCSLGGAAGYCHILLIDHRVALGMMKETVIGDRRCQRVHLAEAYLEELLSLL
jgi:hypothetical protein